MLFRGLYGDDSMSLKWWACHSDGRRPEVEMSQSQVEHGAQHRTMKEGTTPLLKAQEGVSRLSDLLGLTRGRDTAVGQLARQPHIPAVSMRSSRVGAPVGCLVLVSRPPCRSTFSARRRKRSKSRANSPFVELVSSVRCGAPESTQFAINSGLLDSTLFAPNSGNVLTNRCRPRTRWRPIHDLICTFGCADKGAQYSVA